MRFLNYFRGYFKVGVATTLNVVLYSASWKNHVHLEGRVVGGVFRNWIGHYRYTPTGFFRPTTEAQIVELVKGSRSLRVFGAGHSFNDGVVSDGALVSLDKYRGEIRREDLGKNQVAVRGGTRVRDVVDLLSKKGLAFEALPSHDAQSIAGILSTDVHGTDRECGFVSESIVSLRLVDGKGDVHECRPSDDLFKAAIGGVGAVGIITEVVVQGVERFSVEQQVRMEDLSFDAEDAEKDFDRLVERYRNKYEHFSLYLFPFVDKCQVNTWKPTDRQQTPLGELREFISHSKDALAAAWGGNLITYTGLLRFLRLVYGLREGTDLVLDSAQAFNRTMYHLHQELEFTVPFESTFETCKALIGCYKDLYRQSKLPFTIIEVRFTPGDHDRTLIGAGRERHSAWIDLICNDSPGYERYYAEAEELMRRIGTARPHLGKYCRSFGKADMARLHGDNFTKFLKLVEEHDPHGKFANGFTRRLFGHGCS
jgi:hypothetical protein